MALITNGTNQRWSITGAPFNNSKVHTVAVVFKVNTATTTDQFIFGGYNSGGLSRRSGVIYRADQATKYIAKVKSSSTFYYPTLANAGSQFTPSASGWNIFIFSRSVTGGAGGASRRMLNSGTVNTDTSEENGSTDLSLFGGGAWRDSDGVYKNWFDGKVFCVAAWDRVLSVAEENELKSWVNPQSVSGGAPNMYVEFSGSGTATNFTAPTGQSVTFTGSPTLDADTPYLAITGVTPSTLLVGSTGNNVQYIGFTSPVTSIVFGGVTQSITAADLTNATFNRPAFVDGSTIQNPTASQSLVISNSVPETANLSAPSGIPSGNGSVVVASAPNDNPNRVGYYIALTDGDLLIYPSESGNFSLFSDGACSAMTTGLRTCWHWKASSGLLTQLNITVNDAGEIINVSTITSRALTLNGLAAVGLAIKGV